MQPKTPMYWEDFTAARRDRILEQADPLISDYYAGRFIASDDERTENLLDLLTSQQKDKDFRALYFSVFNRILMSSDGALAEMLGPYAIKMVCEEPEYILTYLRENKTLEEEYAHSIGTEILLSQGLSADEGTSMKSVKESVLSKTGDKGLVEPFLRRIESFISISLAWEQVPHIKPDSTATLTYKSKAQFEALYDRVDSGDESALQVLEHDVLYQELYSPACSWYCGGEILSVKASSHLAPIGNMTYEAGNAHDFDHERVWAEGVDGLGIGEYLEYEFPGNCPRITTVKIMNGYVKNETVWKDNARVKQLKMYYQGKPYAILDLEDTRNLQYFNVGVLGPYDADAPNWKLRFEILEVYEGEKYEDTVISELYFDGIDVH